VKQNKPSTAVLTSIPETIKKEIQEGKQEVRRVIVGSGEWKQQQDRQERQH
jgi:hypothetical protein